MGLRARDVLWSAGRRGGILVCWRRTCGVCGVIVAVVWKSVADDKTVCTHYNNVYAYHNIIIVKYY
jgi:hypothetical protein